MLRSFTRSSSLANHITPELRATVDEMAEKAQALVGQFNTLGDQADNPFKYLAERVYPGDSIRMFTLPRSWQMPESGYEFFLSVAIVDVEELTTTAWCETNSTAKQGVVVIFESEDNLRRYTEGTKQTPEYRQAILHELTHANDPRFIKEELYEAKKAEDKIEAYEEKPTESDAMIVEQLYAIEDFYKTQGIELHSLTEVEADEVVNESFTALLEVLRQEYRDEQEDMYQRLLSDENQQKRLYKYVRDLLRTDFTPKPPLRGFVTEAARWTDDEMAILKKVYLQARAQGIPHNKIYDRLSEHIPHSKSGIKQKLEALYNSDDELGAQKFTHWSREKIVEELENLYRSEQPVARKLLPAKLEYQISNHSLPKAITRGFEVYFDSFDHAVAEAINNVGYKRNDENVIDVEQPVDSLEDAYRYYRYNEKKNNPWTKEEIVHLFQKAHEVGLPITKSFFTAHQEVYKPLLGVRRSLDGLRNSIRRLGYTWGDLVMEAVPDYINWYNDTGGSKVSSGELRVRRFLDLKGIPYRDATRADKIQVTEPEVREAGYKNFIPDLFLVDENGNDIALIEVYGAVADSGAGAGELQQKYREKILAKEQVYHNLPIDYIAIHDNSLYGVDLSNDKLEQKFAAFLPEQFTASIDGSTEG